jgi:hypothetical protein
MKEINNAIAEAKKAQAGAVDRLAEVHEKTKIIESECRLIGYFVERLEALKEEIINNKNNKNKYEK